MKTADELETAGFILSFAGGGNVGACYKMPGGDCASIHRRRSPPIPRRVTDPCVVCWFNDDIGHGDLMVVTHHPNLDSAIGAVLARVNAGCMVCGAAACETINVRLHSLDWRVHFPLTVKGTMAADDWDDIVVEPAPEDVGFPDDKPPGDPNGRNEIWWGVVNVATGADGYKCARCGHQVAQGGEPGDSPAQRRAWRRAARAVKSSL